MSEELREKISQTHKGKKKNYKCTGGVKKHSTESKNKISLSKTGKPKRGKVIILKTKDDEKEYPSLTAAYSETGLSITSISNNLKGYSKSTKLGLWKYKTH